MAHNRRSLLLMPVLVLGSAVIGGMYGPSVSVASAASADDDTSLMDALPDSSYNPEEATARAQWRDFAHEKVEEFAGTLEGKELEIFRSRLLSEDPPTLQEVGVKFGISRERVRQIESRLKRRFKAFLKLDGDDFKAES